jgi:hypothetical protein
MDALASQQAMHMLLSQQPLSRQSGSTGVSVPSMQHGGSPAPSHAQSVESSSQSFWASGPQPHGGGKGKGKGTGGLWN